MIIDHSQIPLVVDKLKELMGTCDIFTFSGPLGAGKTTLISELLHKCGVQDPITSPTFTYVNEYENSNHEKFYHFDLYRIDSLDEFLVSGFQEYLYAPASWSFIEWPEIIIPLLQQRVCTITIEYYELEKRAITITVQ